MAGGLQYFQGGQSGNQPGSQHSTAQWATLGVLFAPLRGLLGGPKRDARLMGLIRVLAWPSRSTGQVEQVGQVAPGAQQSFARLAIVSRATKQARLDKQS